jgi:hypothetical protein
MFFLKEQMVFKNKKNERVPEIKHTSLKYKGMKKYASNPTVKHIMVLKY